MKHLACFFLAAVLCCGVLAGCQNDTPAETTTSTVQDDGVTRILMIGHSLGVDSTFLLPQVAKSEGVENLVVGVLYHSGCRLSQHVSYLQSDAREYAYLQFDLTKDKQWSVADANGGLIPFALGDGLDSRIKDGSIGQTMQFAATQQDWDIVMLQAGAFEATGKPTTDSVLKTENIKTIMDYVLSNDVVKETVPVFGWNMIWTLPSDPDLVKDENEDKINLHFGGDHFSIYEMGAKTVKDVIEPFHPFAYMMPVGTAMENAKSSYMEQKEIYRDYAHASDFARVMVAYVWLCRLTGKGIDEMKVEGVIPSAMLTNTDMRSSGTELVLTESQKQVLVESVANALKNPYEMTQSQYTTAP